MTDNNENRLKVRDFVLGDKETKQSPHCCVSLFSGAGLSDIGYELAGFSIAMQAESERDRASFLERNFPKAVRVVGDIRNTWRTIIEEYRKNRLGRPSLLSATPPCQGMSSSNPSRGKVSNPQDGTRAHRNLLVLSIVPIVDALNPRMVVAENVPQFLLRSVTLPQSDKAQRIVTVLEQRLPAYRLFAGIVQMADYGIPQLRRRCIVILIKKDEPCIQWLDENEKLPWPAATHSGNSANGLQPWISLSEWIKSMEYPPLNAKAIELASNPQDPLHNVPVYCGNRYYWIADIPTHSGASAYANFRCRSCGYEPVAGGLAYCPACGSVLINRPHVMDASGKVRLIKGFKSSYRRMHPHRPAPTITTASSHLGSDYKIHPWENRVLSIRECADLQTVPRFYDWQWAIDNHRMYLVRQVIGEAIPPWFTFLHGQVLHGLLDGRADPDALAKAN